MLRSKLNKFTVIFFVLIHDAISVSLLNKDYFSDKDDSDTDIAEVLTSKFKLPKEKSLPKTPLVKHFADDLTFILSKLSDEDLIKLLNQQPKKSEYDLNDIVQITSIKNVANSHIGRDVVSDLDNPLMKAEIFNNKNKRFKTVNNKAKSKAFFRLDHKEVVPYAGDPDAKLYDAAQQKLNNLLKINTQSLSEQDDDDKKAIIFDMLVEQLRALCCGSKRARSSNKAKGLFDPNSLFKGLSKPVKTSSAPHMFLILNEDLKDESSNGDELVSVDPDSLGLDSRVLLLGSVDDPLPDDQLKLMMDRVGAELSKPEYQSILNQLANADVEDTNLKLMTNLLIGPDSRRYIKPHRCNHVSKLARIYGGPKWVVCTGYLNLNTPSLYD